MIYWTGIIIALLIAALVGKKGLYEAWALLFDVTVSIYLAVMLTPVLKDVLSVENNTTASALILFGTAAVSFVILYTLAYILFLNQFAVKFPKAIDLVGGAVGGFIIGGLVWGFIIYLVFSSSMGYSKAFQKIKLHENAQKSINFVKSCTMPVAVLTGADSQLFTERFDTPVKKAYSSYVRKREPVKPKEPEKPKVEIVEEPKKLTAEELGDPPDLEFEKI